jgi:hypothetical protein
MFDVAAFDKLEDYAWALSYAHSLYLTATKPPNDFDELSLEAASMREKLLLDARSLSKHKLVDDKPLDELQGANGIKNIVQDLQTLALLLQKSWANIQGKSPTTAEHLDRALKLSARLMRIIGVKEQGPKLTAEATERRARAYTLTIRVYDETRRAITYLRTREGDAETITPSLYSGKARAKKEIVVPPAKPGEDVPLAPPASGNPSPALTAASKSVPSTSAHPFVES